MGQMILLSCDRCGCKKEMAVGAGLMSNNPDIIASCLSEAQAAEWRQLCSQNKMSHYQARQRAFYCDHCKDLSCQLTVNATLADGGEVIFGDRCEKCGGRLQEVDLEPRHMICPICKKGDLSWKQVGFWD